MDHPLLKVKRIRHPVWSVRDSSNLVDLYERYHKTIVGSVSTTAESRRNAWASLRSDFLQTIPEHNREIEHIQTKIANIKDDVRKYLKALRHNEEAGGSSPPDPQGYVVKMYNIVHGPDTTGHATTPMCHSPSQQTMYSSRHGLDSTVHVTIPPTCLSPPQQKVYDVRHGPDSAGHATTPMGHSPPQRTVYSMPQCPNSVARVITSPTCTSPTQQRIYSGSDKVSHVKPSSPGTSPPQKRTYNATHDPYITSCVQPSSPCTLSPQKTMHNIVHVSDTTSLFKAPPTCHSPTHRANDPPQRGKSILPMEFEIKKEVPDEEPPPNTLEVHQMRLIAEQRYLTYLQTLKVQHELREKAVDFYSFQQFSKGTGIF